MPGKTPDHNDDTHSHNQDSETLGMHISRRRFIGGMAFAASGVALGGCSSGDGAQLPAKDASAAAGGAANNTGSGGDSSNGGNNTGGNNSAAGDGSSASGGGMNTGSGTSGGSDSSGSDSDTSDTGNKSDASDSDTGDQDTDSGQDQSNTDGSSGGNNRLPNPEDSGIEHIIVVMMENRSFDHMLGWLPGSEGKQKGLKYPDNNGQIKSTYRLAPDYQGCGMADPGHSYSDFHDQFDGGKLDGFLKTQSETFAIGYYTQDDLDFFGGAAPAWTTFDHYFAATSGPTFPNRLFMHSAQTDRLGNTPRPTTLPTIWDRLADAGVSRRYYFNDAPFLALWGAKYLPISQPYAKFKTDAAAGNLPAVSYIDPFFGDEQGGGTGNGDHPFSDVRDGQAFLNDVYEAVISSPNWKNTVLLINYDEWGGFFDHVTPPRIPKIAQATQQALDADPEAAKNFVQRNGFRTPALMISPLARRGHVASAPYDHTSILKMIEWRFGLEPLTVRDKNANNIARELNFESDKNLNTMTFPAPSPANHRGDICPSAIPAPSALGELQELRPEADRLGFVLPDRDLLINSSSDDSSSGGANDGSSGGSALDNPVTGALSGETQ